MKKYKVTTTDQSLKGIESSTKEFKTFIDARTYLHDSYTKTITHMFENNDDTLKMTATIDSSLNHYRIIIKHEKNDSTIIAARLLKIH